MYLHIYFRGIVPYTYRGNPGQKEKEPWNMKMKT